MISREEAIAKTKTIFNAASDHFDAPALSFWNRVGQQTIERLELGAGDRLLDVCCGTGASAIPAALQVGSTGQVLGVDLAESMLELARNKAQQQGLEQIEFRCGDFETLGLPNDSFDAIVCVFGIFFVPDMAAAARELWRMLRPGGKLAITTWGAQILEPANQLFWDAVGAERPDLVKKMTPSERLGEPDLLRALLEAVGATQIEVFAESVLHELASPEDWWTIVLGSGYRGTIDQLDPPVREQVRQANLRLLRAQGVDSLAVDVLYAVAQKSG